ncbi:hypothetical protein CK203_088148 [Vitis vinifera]|uniref:Uncharacterized protein n=1 Tax=Vitis vinifera TaxID=29760 RepID=A0A438DPA0_VITVI|nr:hypothetical protein CK203_088148 [Vitis vinifera]
MSGCQMLGRGVESRVVGILTSQGILMIGNWKRWRACFENSILWQISTIDQLKKRGWNMPNSGFCILQLKGIYLVGMVPLWVRGGRRLGGLPLYA